MLSRVRQESLPYRRTIHGILSYDSEKGAESAELALRWFW